jgi:5-methylcytosine-specific restriction protein A
MIKEIFQNVFENYAEAAKENVEGHPFAEWLRKDIPLQFEALTPAEFNYRWVASHGKGRWADAPWVAVFDPLVTTTAQDGYYPVYLFTRNLDAVYISMNQGMAALREEFGVKAREILEHRASILRTRLSPHYLEKFPLEVIDLQASGTNTRLAFYEHGHAFGKQYQRDNLPREDELVEDLLTMLDLYSEATMLGGTEEFGLTGHSIGERGSEYRPEETLEEKRRLRMHYRVERNPELAKRAKEIHGYKCQVCGFDFEQTYGELGKNFIEAHHLTPLSELPPEKPIMLSPESDFAVLCSNCHSMIHRLGAPRTLSEFKKLYKKI